MTRAWIVSFGVFVLMRFVTVSNVSAHHSFTMYDLTETLVLKGTVVRFRWVNPHAVLSVSLSKDGQEPRTWNLELSSPGNLTRAGLTRDSFKADEEVQVTFNPLRNGQPGGACRSVTVLATGQILECAAGTAIRAGERPNLP
jgi:hypothetical protein